MTGSFLGVVAGSIRFSYFHELFGRLISSPDDTITVLRRDRTIIMRTPFDLDIIGRNLASMRPIWNRDNLPEPTDPMPGSARWMATPRLFVRRNGTSPLVVRRRKAIGQHLQPVAHGGDPDRRRFWCALILFVLGATLFLAREIGRRAEAEEKLEELATTDALTGLKNRRKFDAEIDAEWRRAARQNEPVALLMIDADHFKTYNDTYGHQAGDQVLVGIAICISDSVRRAGDCTARVTAARSLPCCCRAIPPRKRWRWPKPSAKGRAMVGRADVTTVSIGVASADARPRPWTGPIWWKPPTRRSTPPRPMAATAPWWPACRSCRWWREGPPSFPAGRGLRHGRMTLRRAIPTPRVAIDSIIRPRG